MDGFHRHEIGKGSSSLKLRLKGYLPVTCLEGTRHQRIAATIRHNRARGRHQITAMSEIEMCIRDRENSQCMYEFHTHYESILA